ncbi:MAG: hypothetical protein BWY21_02137 [Parcubacteria group bacterium ADurb.Bin216]|nr:MAG: hypothetical protein BWY21_02137 [Parcubacteria group bacterium ADurb.Bin216]
MGEKLLTVEDVQNALPSRKNAITQELVDVLNEVKDEAEFQGEPLLNTAVVYEKLMINNKASVREFVDAIRFCAYLVTMDDNYTEAYKKTFYYRDFVKERISADTKSIKYAELTSAASRYRRNNKLVADLLVYSQAPLEIMFLGWRYKAVGVLADTMMNAKLDRDKINAAKELLVATKGPETKRIELDIGVKENSAIASLNEQLSVMAGKQVMLLESGARELSDFGSLKPKQEDVVDAEIY